MKMYTTYRSGKCYGFQFTSIHPPIKRLISSMRYAIYLKQGIRHQLKNKYARRIILVYISQALQMCYCRIQLHLPNSFGCYLSTLCSKQLQHLYKKSQSYYTRDNRKVIYSVDAIDLSFKRLTYTRSVFAIGLNLTSLFFF